MPEQISDSMLLVLEGPNVTESLGAHLTDSKHYMYMLTDGRYLKVQKQGPWSDGPIFALNAQGTSYGKGIDEFIEVALAEEHCIGLVPMTPNAQAALVRRGLRPVRRGLGLEPEGISYAAYGRD